MGGGLPQKMLKMKVDPTMCMKTKTKGKLSPTILPDFAGFEPMFSGESHILADKESAHALVARRAWGKDPSPGSAWPPPSPRGEGWNLSWRAPRTEAFPSPVERVAEGRGGGPTFCLL
jgi:hypothetical protein